jgi:hypothetical protein
MTFKQTILLFGIIILVSILFGCVNNNSDKSSYTNLKPGHGVVGDSEFELESGWYQKPISGNEYEANFNFNKTDSKNVIFMRLTQFNSKSEYEKDYGVVSQPTSTWIVQSSEIESIEGLNVKTVKLSRKDDTETIKYYFFEKTEKYYKVLIDMGGYNGSQSYFDEHKYLVDSTIKKIILTIH